MYNRATNTVWAASSTSTTRCSAPQGLMLDFGLWEDFKTSIINNGRILQSIDPSIREKYSTKGSGAPCHVSFGFFSGSLGWDWQNFRLTLSWNLQIDLRLGDYIPYGIFHMVFNARCQDTKSNFEDLREKNSGRLGLSYIHPWAHQGDGSSTDYYVGLLRGPRDYSNGVRQCVL
jgi:hypothetical protein